MQRIDQMAGTAQLPTPAASLPMVPVWLWMAVAAALVPLAMKPPIPPTLIWKTPLSFNNDPGPTRSGASPSV